MGSRVVKLLIAANCADIGKTRHSFVVATCHRLIAVLQHCLNSSKNMLVYVREMSVIKNKLVKKSWINWKTVRKYKYFTIKKIVWSFYDNSNKI